MTAEAILEKNIRYDRGGKPLEVVISYQEFVEFVESYGLDLTLEERKSINEAEADRKAGRTENFVKMEDLEDELGIWCVKLYFIVMPPNICGGCLRIERPKSEISCEK